ncbi:MAG: AAA family ATPase [Gemmataceae bacterium]|nr:AAA family ATPase [Gemmataceae bacterium]
MPDFASLGSWDLQAGSNEKSLTWLWDGIIVRGNLTLLTSVWKSGKSTLVSLLLDRRREADCCSAAGFSRVRRWSSARSRKELWASRLRRLNFSTVSFIPLSSRIWVPPRLSQVRGMPLSGVKFVI